MPIGNTEEERKKWLEIFETIFKPSIEASGLGLRANFAGLIKQIIPVGEE